MSNRDPRGWRWARRRDTAGSAGPAGAESSRRMRGIDRLAGLCTAQCKLPLGRQRLESDSDASYVETNSIQTNASKVVSATGTSVSPGRTVAARINFHRLPDRIPQRRVDLHVGGGFGRIVHVRSSDPESKIQPVATVILAEAAMVAIWQSVCATRRPTERRLAAIFHPLEMHLG